MEVLNLLKKNQCLQNSSKKFHNSSRMSRKILKNHSKIKISISLHLSRNFIRSEPCFKWREVSLHGNRLISPIAAEAGELPKNGGEKVNDSSQLQGLPPSISDWARARAPPAQEWRRHGDLQKACSVRETWDSQFSAKRWKLTERLQYRQ